MPYMFGLQSTRAWEQLPRENTGLRKQLVPLPSKTLGDTAASREMPAQHLPRGGGGFGFLEGWTLDPSP